MLRCHRSGVNFKPENVLSTDLLREFLMFKVPIQINFSNLHDQYVVLHKTHLRQI